MKETTSNEKHHPAIKIIPQSSKGKKRYVKLIYIN